MTNYKKMYLTLIGEVSKTIDCLTTAMQKAEDIYIESCKDEHENANTTDGKEITASE